MTRGCQLAVEKVDNIDQIVVNKSDQFTFNFVFDWRSTQEEVYNSTVSDMVDKCLRGINVRILAYGQTGSGKTHTMGTTFDGCLDEHAGIIPRAVHDIFEGICKMKDDFEFVVRCSFVEIYQEKLFDLLSDETRKDRVVHIRENGVVGLTEKIVSSAKAAIECLVNGSSVRAVAATAMNQESSRSHAIFTITIIKKENGSNAATSNFHLVDLAGSECAKKTQATGDYFKESITINQGLFALGNVISACSKVKGSIHVPYRDSKLTRLLRISIGGNSMTLMIACVSPADYNVPETLNTLRYADRALKIENKPIVNQDPDQVEINRLKCIIQNLRMELQAKGCSSLDAELKNITASSMSSELPSFEENRKYKDLQEKYYNLQRQSQMILHDVTEYETQAHIFEEIHEYIKKKIVEIKLIVNDLNDVQIEIPADKKKVKTLVLQINDLAENVEQGFERTNAEILDNKKRSSIVFFPNNDLKEEECPNHLINSSFQDDTEAFTNKQMESSEQLRRVNLELAVKQQLQQQITGNFSRHSTLDNNIDEKFKQCEQKIQELEKETSDLLEKLRHVKLAEKRRLQALEIDISEMKRENMLQAKLLKIHEKETQKINSLNAEIQGMKEAKVKLVRTMKQESENFRQCNITNAKEIIQLKTHDRKLQNEMTRKEAAYNQQCSELRRKYEEALAINKRLKDALDRQKVAQIQRQPFNSSKDSNVASTNIAETIAYVKRELEVIESLTEAECTLEQLKDDRSIINSHLEELQQQQCDDNTTVDDELKNLRDGLEMRDNQIGELQQKVCANDIKTIMRNLSDAAHSLVEARTIIKYLLKMIIEMQRETIHSHEYFTMAEGKYLEANKNMDVLKQEYEHVIAKYEKKISLALMPEQEQSLQLQEQQERKIETLLIEIEEYKKILNFETKPSKGKSECSKIKPSKNGGKSVERSENDKLSIPFRVFHSCYDSDSDAAKSSCHSYYDSDTDAAKSSCRSYYDSDCDSNCTKPQCQKERLSIFEIENSQDINQQFRNFCRQKEL
uniref:Kinesin motor domain-containing protein n=1 Tax=Glossina brevipalpis TaxID=37001 RepID=A0A1A9WVS1_9MUSC